MVAGEADVKVITVECKGTDLVFTPSSLSSARMSDGNPPKCEVLYIDGIFILAFSCWHGCRHTMFSTDSGGTGHVAERWKKGIRGVRVSSSNLSKSCSDDQLKADDTPATYSYTI